MIFIYHLFIEDFRCVLPTRRTFRPWSDWRSARIFWQLFGPKKPRFAKEKTSKNIKKHGEHHVLATKMRVLNGLTGKNEFVSPRYFARVGHNPVKSAYSAKVLGPVLG
jgi:hypothetical protein